jgi:capsular exopolysaccharide synthesis family protein
VFLYCYLDNPGERCGKGTDVEIDLRHLLRLARRRGWLVLLIMLVCGSAAYMRSAREVDLYTTNTRLLLLGSENTGSDYTGLLTTQQLAATYQQLVKNDEIMQRVVDTLHLPISSGALASQITVSLVPDTLLMQISVMDTDPRRAAKIADTTAQQFVAYINEHKGPTLSAPVEVSTTANVPGAPFAPTPMRSGEIGLFVGLLLGIGIVALLEYFDSTVKPERDLPGIIGAPILASIPQSASVKPGVRQVFTMADPQAIAAEAMRLLRTNLEFASASGDLNKLVVSSPVAGEGKSTVVANLGIVMAQNGLRTVIIDADLRKPSQARIFGVPDDEGLTTLLTHPEHAWTSIAQAVALPELWLIPSGPLPPDPADMVSSKRFAELLDRVSAEADMVIIDSPPVLAAADTLAIASRADGLMFVCFSHKTRLDALQHATRSVQQGGIRLVGIVLNRMKHQHGPTYYGEYYRPTAESRPQAAPASPGPAQSGAD